MNMACLCVSKWEAFFLLNQTMAVFFVEVFLVETFNTETFVVESCIDLVEIHVNFAESRFNLV